MPSADDVARSGEALFVSQIAVIDRVIAFICARHHLSAADAEDFASYVKLKLIEDDYAILRKFEGRSAIRTYLTVVIERLFLDDRIRAWGKWRPSAAARRTGPVAVLLEQLIVRDGYSFDEACELMTTNHRVAESRADLEGLAARLPLRLRRRRESEDILESVPAPERSDAAALAAEQERMSARVAAALVRAKARFEPSDQLLLALRFEDGRTVAEVASMLHVDQKGLYRRFDKLLRQLRDALEMEGITAAEARESFDGLAVTSSDAPARGKTMAGPSLVRGAR